MMRPLALIFVVGVACGSVKGAMTDANNRDTSAGDAPAGQSGTVVWVRSMSSAFALGVADGPGGLIFTSSITAPTDLGGGLMTPTSADDMAIGDYMEADGSYVYQVRHGEAGVGQTYGFLEHTDTLGNPLIHGVSYGDVDLGLGGVTGGSGSDTTYADGFIGRYGPNAPAWVDRLVGPGDDKLIATAPAPGSEIYAAGWFEDTTTWNGTNITSTGGRDIFFAKLNTFTGAVDLTRTFGGTGRDEISGAAGDGTNLVLGGFFDDTLSLGNNTAGTAVPAVTATGGGLDLWIAKLDATPAPIWLSHFGGTLDDRGTYVAIDAAGDVYFAAQYQNQVAFGAVNLMSLGIDDIVVAKLHGNTGAVAWAISIGTTADDSPSSIVIDPAGNVVVTGSVGGPLGSNPSLGGTDAFITSLDPSNGSTRWLKIISSSGADSVWSATIGAAGELFAAVNLGGAVDFGVPVIGPAGPASVVMRIVP